jgi:hypothetical protein
MYCLNKGKALSVGHNNRMCTLISRLANGLSFCLRITCKQHPEWEVSVVGRNVASIQADVAC